MLSYICLNIIPYKKEYVKRFFHFSFASVRARVILYAYIFYWGIALAIPFSFLIVVVIFFLFSFDKTFLFFSFVNNVDNFCFMVKIVRKNLMIFDIKKVLITMLICC